MNTVPTPLHQRIVLDVDVAARCLRGYTELKVSCPPDAASIGLHVLGLDIKSVTVDNTTAAFSLRPEQQGDAAAQAAPRQSAAAAAEAGYFSYQATLQREAEPELSIQLPAAAAPQTAAAGGQTAAAPDAKPGIDARGSAQQAGAAAANGTVSAGASVGRGSGDSSVRQVLIRVHYAVTDPACGIRFWGGFAHTHAQLRRARAWVPCVDTPGVGCPVDLAITVARNETAVASGMLQRTTWAAAGARKTFHFSQPRCTPPSHVAFAVGAFKATPMAFPVSPLTTGAAADPNDAGVVLPNAVLTHFAPAGLSGKAAKVAGRPSALTPGPAQRDDTPAAASEHTANFLPLAFAFFEEALGSKFPHAAFHQVFLPAEAATSLAAPAAAMHMLSTELLVYRRTIDQAIESWRAIVAALARQWFGVFIRPRTPADAWLLAGLAGWLEGQFVRTFRGANELSYRRYKEREAIFALDDGLAPPLSPLGPAAGTWGRLQGTDSLDASSLGAWKATAVIGMLERRAGEDAFRKLVAHLVFAACSQSPADELAAGGGARMLSTAQFLKDVGTAGGFRKQIPAFAARWVHGRGTPRLTAAFAYNRKRNNVELAVRQWGSEAARRGAERSANAGGDASSAAILRVTIRELDGTMDHALHIGRQPLVLGKFKIATRPSAWARRPKRKPQPGEDTALFTESDVMLGKCPIYWMRIDPTAEWLAPAVVQQPPHMWGHQLLRSREVPAQAAAAAALAEAGASGALSPGGAGALREALASDKVYCRIRCDCAMALAVSVGQPANPNGLQLLLKHHATLTGASGTAAGPRPAYADLAEYFVAQGLARALAAVRDRRGRSPPEVVDALLAALQQGDSAGSVWHDSGMVAAHLEALGQLAPPSAEAMQRLVKALQQNLAREAVLPSIGCVVGAAAVASLARLAIASGDVSLVAPRLLEAFGRFTMPLSPPPLRRAAHAAGSALLYALRGADATVNAALDAAAAEKSPTVRASILHAALSQLPRPAPPQPSAKPPQSGAAVAAQAAAAAAAAQAAAGDSPDALQLPAAAAPPAANGPPAEPPQPGAVAPATLQRLSAAVAGFCHDPAARHAAFMLLQAAAGQPATLFRETDEEDAAAADTGPAASAQTARKPAASGAAGAVSHDSGGRIGRGAIKVRLPGAPSKMATSGAPASPSRHTAATAAADAEGEVKSRQPITLKLTPPKPRPAAPPQPPAVASSVAAPAQPSASAPVSAAAAAAAAAAPKVQLPAPRITLKGSFLGARGSGGAAAAASEPAVSAPPPADTPTGLDDQPLAFRRAAAGAKPKGKGKGKQKKAKPAAAAPAASDAATAAPPAAADAAAAAPAAGPGAAAAAAPGHPAAPPGRGGPATGPAAAGGIAPVSNDELLALMSSAAAAAALKPKKGGKRKQPAVAAGSDATAPEQQLPPAQAAMPPPPQLPRIRLKPPGPPPQPAQRQHGGYQAASPQWQQQQQQAWQQPQQPATMQEAWHMPQQAPQQAPYEAMPPPQPQPPPQQPKQQTGKGGKVKLVKATGAKANAKGRQGPAAGAVAAPAAAAAPGKQQPKKKKEAPRQQQQQQQQPQPSPASQPPKTGIKISFGGMKFGGGGGGGSGGASATGQKPAVSLTTAPSDASTTASRGPAAAVAAPAPKPSFGLKIKLGGKSVGGTAVAGSGAGPSGGADAGSRKRQREGQPPEQRRSKQGKTGGQ